jgi:hypothetical protein
MAASIPSQQRTVDPFSSYGSNVVTKLTKMVTYDEEGLANTNSLRVTEGTDATTTVVVSTGFAYKRSAQYENETLIHVDSTAIVDFSNPDHYYNFDTGFTPNGYYYIVLNYTYAKSRPAPQASYQIIKPNQRGSFSIPGSWLFLAVVNIIGTELPPGQQTIVEILDYDPDDTDNKRLYVKSYAGAETFLPTHDQTRDQSRIVYDSTSNEFYFGYSDRWGIMNANVFQTTINVGDWILDGGSGNYYAVVTHSIGTQYNTITVADNIDNMKIEPLDIEFVSSSETWIWMPDNTHTLHVAIAG